MSKGDANLSPFGIIWRQVGQMLVHNVVKVLLKSYLHIHLNLATLPTEFRQDSRILTSSAKLKNNNQAWQWNMKYTNSLINTTFGSTKNQVDQISCYPSWDLRFKWGIVIITDYRCPGRKSPSLNGWKSTPTPKFLGTAKAYFVCHIGPNFQISLIYAFIGCP